jgi:hypothetical protein
MMQVDFFSKLASSNYDVFIVVDNSAYCPKWKTHSVQYIKVEGSKCSSAGFKHLNPTVTRAKTVRQCSAWEKALYYFSRLEMSYDNVWFIEDDVLIPTTDTIRMIDSRHGKADIISASNNIDENPHIDSWYWLDMSHSIDSRCLQRTLWSALSG